MSVTFASGLASSTESFYEIPVADIETYIKSKNDLYEVTFRHGTTHGRAHIDIDGKMTADVSQEDFDATNQFVLMALSLLDVGTPFSLSTSSKYGNTHHSTGNLENKLSYSMVFLNKCGSKAAVQNWTISHVAPLIKEATKDIIPFYIPTVDKEKPVGSYIDFDNAVYTTNRKMRAVGSTKPKENRPKIIHSEHGIMDTLISYIPDGCEALPEPEVKVVNEIIVPVTVSEPSVLRDIVMGLNPSRADDRKDWLTVGIALYNERESCDVWEEFSKQSSKYRWGECQRLWRGFREGNLTQRSLWRMLKEDNPEVFKTLCVRQKDLLTELDGDITNFSCAKYFMNNRPENYLYDTNSGWWCIQANKTWINSVKVPPTLGINISRLLYSDFEDARAIVRKRVLERGDRDDPETEWDRVTMKKLLDGGKHVLTAGFIKATIEFCQGLYAEQTTIRLDIAGKSTVREMMDSNPMIFAFKDSVHDFTLSDGVAVGKRAIDSTDYITTTCGYNYPVANPAVRQKMEEVLKGIWSKQGEYGDNGETYSYVMKILSSTLCGTRWQEAFYILTGSGRNGKGLLFELLQAVMGDYYYQLPVQVLTTKIDNPRAANPDIANLVGKRLACSTEPETNEKLHEGTVKYMTGGDKLTGRALYGSPIQFKPQFGLFLQCNNIPNFNGITRGGVMRNRVIPFPFEFKNDPKTNREKQGNPHVKDVLCKSPEWRDEMFLLMLDHFESIRGKSIDAIQSPRLVEERTEEYVLENNLIGVWWGDNYIQEVGSYILTTTIYRAFKADNPVLIIGEKQIKAGLEYNLVEIKKVKERGSEFRDKICIVNWRAKTEEEKKKMVEEPGSDDEKKE